MTEGMPLRDNVASTYMSPNIRVQRAPMHESHSRTPWIERGRQARREGEHVRHALAVQPGPAHPYVRTPHLHIALRQ